MKCEPDGLLLTRRRPAAAMLIVVLLSAAAPAWAEATVAIVKGTDPDAMVAEAVKLVGGLKGIVRDGQRVVIKPNLTYYQRWRGLVRGMTTDVRVVRKLVEMLRAEADCKITIAEGSGMEAAYVYKVYGYTEMAKELKLPLVDLAKDRFVPVKLADGLAHKEYKLPATTQQQCDVLINVPVLKTHQLCGVTVGMKNLFGLLPMRRDPYHENIEKVLVDLSRARPSHLVVVDGLYGMEGQGPLSGQPVKMDLIVAGTDVVAVDAVCTAIMGFDPKRVEHVQNAAAAGLGESDLNKITVKGVPIAKVRRAFAPSHWYATVRLRKTDERVKRIKALADRVTKRWRAEVAHFEPKHLKVDSKKYPTRESFGFQVEISPRSRYLSFTVPFKSLWRENRPAAEAEMQAWIKAKLTPAAQSQPTTQPKQ